ncbi:MAG TPA: serine/threonine-protein kinase [Polyangiaceae bacterium]
MSSTLKAGRYTVSGVLGSGSQGETLAGVDTTTDRPVAIKRFSVRGAASWKDVELAEREARVLQALEHPRLPRYIDHFEENGALFLVMERVEGESLAVLRKRNGTLARGDVVRMLADVGEVLDYLHGRAPPIIHRDIKPSNVIRRTDGSFCLVDFGSVRDTLKPEGGSTVVGTFGFMAPEQFQGRALAQSDVYALGATALTLLTGRDPEELPHRGLAIDVVQALPHEPAFARVLTRMLDPDPDRRAARVAPLVPELVPPEPSFEAPRSWAPGASAQGSWRSRSQPPPRSRGSRPPHGSRPPRHGMRRHVPGGLVMLVVIIGLVVARFSTGALFRVFLPIVLTLLSLFFGGGLRRAASRMRDIGEKGDEGLKHAMDVVRGRSGAPERPSRRRMRVEEWDEYDEDDEDYSARSAERRRRRQ